MYGIAGDTTPEKPSDAAPSALQLLRQRLLARDEQLDSFTATLSVVRQELAAVQPAVINTEDTAACDNAAAGGSADATASSTQAHHDVNLTVLDPGIYAAEDNSAPSIQPLLDDAQQADIDVAPSLQHNAPAAATQPHQDQQQQQPLKLASPEPELSGSHELTPTPASAESSAAPAPSHDSISSSTGSSRRAARANADLAAIEAAAAKRMQEVAAARLLAEQEEAAEAAAAEEAARKLQDEMAALQQQLAQQEREAQLREERR